MYLPGYPLHSFRHTTSIRRFGSIYISASKWVAVLALAFITVGASRAATITFTGGGGGTGTTLDNPANWSTAAIPTTTDEAVLDNSVITLPSGLTLSTSQVFGDLVINSSSLGSISLTGSTSQNITLSGGAGSTAAIAAGGAAGDLLLLGTNVTGAVTIGGGNGGGNLGLVLGIGGNIDIVNSSASANITGVISGGVGFAKTGSGTLILSNSNTFTGGVTLSAGTLDIQTLGALGTGNLTINGGVIDNTSGAPMTLGNNPAIAINGSFTYAGSNGAFAGSNSLNLGTGGVTLGSVGTPSPLITVTTGTLTIGGAIGNGTGGNQLMVTGGGTLVLSGPNTFSGGLVIDGGTVVANAGSAAGSGAVTLGAGSGSTPASFLANSFTIANAINLGATSGLLTIGNNGGATAVTFAGAIGLAGNNLTVASSGTGSVTITGGITGIGNLTISDGSSSATTTLSTAAVNNTGTITNNGSGFGTATISAGVGANVTSIIENSAASGLTISGALTPNGTATTLVNNSNFLLLSGSLILSGGVANTAGNIIVDNNSVINGGVNFSAGVINNIGAFTNQGTGIGSVTVAATFGAAVTSVVENSPTSTLALSGANTAYVDGFTITSGTLSSSSSSAPFGTGAGTIFLGDTTSSNTHNATLLYASTATITNPITVNAGSSGLLSIIGSNTSIFNSVITLNNGLTLANIGSGTTTTFGGSFSSNLPVTIGAFNTGTIVFTGGGYTGYTGTLTLAGGTLKLTAASNTFSSGTPLTIAGTSTFNYQTAASTAGSQTLGALTFAAGEGTVDSTWESVTTALAFASLAPRSSGATGNFVVLNGANGTTNKIVITSPPTAQTLIDPGIFFGGGAPSGSVGGDGYATYDSGGFLRAYNYSTDVNAGIVTAGGATLGAVAGENIQFTGTSITTTTSQVGNGGNQFTVSSAAGLAVGDAITLSNFAAGTTITAIAGNTITLSNNATGTTNSGATFTAYSAITAQTTLSINTLNLAGPSNNFTLAAGQILTVDGILKTGNSAAGIFTATGGTGGTGGIEPAGNSDLVVRTDQSSDALTLTTNILQNGAGTGALVKDGAGTLTLASGYANNLTGGLFLNGGTYAVSTDAAIGAASVPVVFNGGALQANAGFTLDSSHAITINAGGATITPNGQSLTIAGNISGPGRLTFGGNSGTLILSGNNTFSGGILYNPGQGTNSDTITLMGANAGGTGSISEPANFYQDGSTLNLRSDTTATFSVASVIFNTTDDYQSTSLTTINVGPITNGVTNKTLTLYSVTTPNDQNPGQNGGSFVITGSAGYTLAIDNLVYNNSLLTANIPVVIGSITENNEGYTVTLQGSVGGTVGTVSANNNGYGSRGGLEVAGGAWTITGNDNGIYGGGPWTNNSGGGNGGTEITAAGLGITNDLALGTVPSSAVNNIGLVNSGTLEALNSFTLNSNRNIGIGSAAATGTDTGVIDVASGQTLTYNGIIETSATATNTGIQNLRTTPSGGTLILGGPNTYNGTTTVSGGTLLLNNSTLTTGTGAVTVNSGATLGGIGTIKGAVSIIGAGNLTPGLSGSGVLTLNSPLTLTTGNNVNFQISSPTAYTQIAMGSKSITFGGTLNVTIYGSPVFAVNQTYDLFSFSGSETGTFSAINLPNVTPDGLKWSNFNYANGTITLLPLVISYTNPEYTLTLAPTAINAHTGATVNLTSTITNTGGASTSDSFNYTGLTASLTGGSGGTVGGPTGNTGTGGPVSYQGQGSTTGLTYTNTDPGTYTLTSTVGSVTGNNGTTPTLNGSAGTATINFYTGQSTWSENNNPGSWLDYSNWDSTGGAPGVYASNPTGDTATFGDNNPGPATVNLDGANPSLTSITFVNFYTIYTIAQGSGGTLSLAGAGANINVTGSDTISAPLVLNSDSSFITNYSSDGLLISGNISGAGSADNATLTISGPGVVTLSGNNTYTGGTIIQSGAFLDIGSGGTTGNLGAGAVDDEGTLSFNRSDAAMIVSNNISGAGVVQQIGTGTVTLSGINTYLGGTNIDSGILEFTSTSSLPSTGNVNVAAGATFAVSANASGGSAGWTSANIDALQASTSILFDPNAYLAIDASTAAGATFTYNSAITNDNGGANAVKLATVGGTLVLGGSNTFSGGLYLNAGILSASSDSNLGASGGSITFNGGAIEPTGASLAIAANRAITVNAAGGTIDTRSGGTFTVAGNITGTGLLTINPLNGSANAVFSGNNSAFSGGFQVNGGGSAIEWDGTNASGTGALYYPGQYTSYYLNLRSNTSGTFLASNVSTATFDGNHAGPMQISVNNITSGTGNVLTLNAVTLANLGNNGLPDFNITGGNGYSLAITTFTQGGGPLLINPTSANVAITNFNSGYPVQLGGTANGSSIQNISTSGANGVTVVSGTWTFDGTSIYTGPTSITGGGGVTLKLDFSAPTSPSSNIVSPGSLLALAQGTFLLNGAPAAVNSQTMSGSTFNSGDGNIVLNANGASSLVLSLANIVRNVGSTVEITLPAGAQSTANGIVTASGTAGAILTGNGGVAYAVIGGNDWAAIASAGSNIVGLSTLSGYTPSTSNSLSGNADIAPGVTSTVLAAPTSITSLRLNQNQATTIDLGGNVLTTGGILETSAVATAGTFISDGTLEGAAGADLVIFQNSAQPLTISASIADNTSATGLTLSGIGTVVSTGHNTYSGITTVNGGVLYLAGTDTAAVGATVNGGTLQIANLHSLPSGTLTVNNGGTFAASVGASLANLFDNSTSGAGSLGAFITGATWNPGSILGVDTTNTGGSFTYTGVISGNEGLAKMGTGTLTLGAVSNYLGATYIYGGGTLANGVNNALPVAGSAGNNTPAAATFLTFGTLGESAGDTNTYDLGGFSQVVSGLSNIGSAAAVVTNSVPGTGTLTIADSTNSTFGGTIQNGDAGLGVVALSATGVGTFRLTGVDPYTGATAVSNGTLIVSGSLTGTVSASVAANSTMKVDGLVNGAATIAVSGTLRGTGSVGSVNVTGGGTLAPGPQSALATPGALTATGNVTLDNVSTFLVSLGVVSGTDCDQLAVPTGTVTLDNTPLQITIGGVLDKVADAGDLYQIIVGGAGATGSGTDLFSYNGVPIANDGTFTTPGGYTFMLIYGTDGIGSDDMGTGNNVELLLSPVPEPGTWAMLLSGAGLLVGIQRMRRKRNR